MLEWVMWGGVAFTLVGIIWIFNTFVRLSNQVRTAWSDVDIQLTRRHDLVPSLVKVVSAYADHENQLFNEVVRLRGEALNLESPSKLATLEEGIKFHVNRILMLQESYPELKSSTNFLELQHQLVEIEDELQYARRFYNGAVRDYNDAVQMFPYRLFARPFGFLLFYSQFFTTKKLSFGEKLATRLILLVGPDTASAAELFAGTLQQLGRTYLVGQTTFGKCSSQTVAALRDGSSLRYTNLEVLLPEGSSYSGVGITPDRILSNAPLAKALVESPGHDTGNGRQVALFFSAERHLEAGTKLMNIKLILSLAVALLMLPGLLAAQEETTADIIMQLMLEHPPIVPEGSMLVGSGSWVTGKNYIDPLTRSMASDHDMRLLMPKGTSIVDAKQAYARVRTQLVARINAKFPGQASAVLKSTTLYPPEQMMYGVASEADAELVIRSMGFDSPNLGDEAVEGLYGRGRRAFVRSYETQKGRVFYRVGDRMTSGRADLLPRNTYTGFDHSTVFGAAGNADGFISKTFDAITAGDARVVGKQIERIEASLMKAQGLSGLDRTQSAAFKKLMAEIKKNPDFFIDDPSVRQQLFEYTRQAKLKANLLRNLKKANSADQHLIKTMIADIDSDAAGGKFAQMFKNVPLDKIGTALNVAMTAYTAYIVHGKYMDGDVDGALRTAGVSATFKALGLGPGLVAMMANTAIEQAKGLGLAFYDDFMHSLTSSQYCDDLLGGFYTVRGREHQVTDSSVTPVNIDQLVQRYHLLEDVEPVVNALVLQRAGQASQRSFGALTEALSDRQVVDRLVKDCVPYVLVQWHMERLRLETEFLQRYVALQDAPLVLHVDPDPTLFDAFNDSNRIRVRLQTPTLDLHATQQEMEQILSGLAGSDHRRNRYTFYLWLSVNWSVNGESVSSRSADGLSIEFPVTNEARSHEVKAEVKLQYRFAGKTGYPNLLEDIVREEAAIIDVEFGTVRIEAASLSDLVPGQDHAFKFIGEEIPSGLRSVRFDYAYGTEGEERTGSVEAEVLERRAEATALLSFAPVSGSGDEGVEETQLVRVRMMAGHGPEVALAEDLTMVTLAPASVTIDGPRPLTLTIAPDTLFVDHEFLARAHPTTDHVYRWSFGDGSSRDDHWQDGAASRVSHRYASPKDGDEFTVRVVLLDPDHRTSVLAEDEIRLVIVADDEPPEPADEPDGSTSSDRIGVESDVEQEERSGAAQETRRVVDLDATELQDLLNCLCRASLGGASHVAQGYNLSIPSWTDPKIHSCGSLANGPCMASGFGCWRRFIKLNTDAARRCMERWRIHPDSPNDLWVLDQHNREHEQDLEVELHVRPQEVCPGDQVHVSVTSTGGRGDYTYSYDVHRHFRAEDVPPRESTEHTLRLTVDPDIASSRWTPLDLRIAVAVASPSFADRHNTQGRTDAEGSMRVVQLTAARAAVRLRSQAECSPETAPRTSSDQDEPADTPPARVPAQPAVPDAARPKAGQADQPAPDHSAPPKIAEPSASPRVPEDPAQIESSPHSQTRAAPIAGRLVGVVPRTTTDFATQGPNLTGNGRGDALFRIAVTAPGDSVTAIEIRSTPGTLWVWDTVPGNSRWALAAVIDGQLVNRSDSSVHIPLSRAETVIDLFVEAHLDQVGDNRTDYRIGVSLQSGRQLSIDVPASLPVGLPGEDLRATGPVAGGRIRVLGATYGGNCGAARNNVTQDIAARCDGLGSCHYVIDHTVIGDPVWGCSKDYEVIWDCGDGEQRRASVPPEAGYRRPVRLDCPAASSTEARSAGSPRATAPTAQLLAFERRSTQDLTRPANQPPTPDGQPDAVIKVRLHAPGDRLVGVDLRSTSGPLLVWDTSPSSSYWRGAVVVEGQVRNRTDSPLDVPLHDAPLSVAFHFSPAQFSSRLVDGRTGLVLTLLLATGEQITVPVAAGFQ